MFVNCVRWFWEVILPNQILSQAFQNIILDSVQWDWISGLNGRPITWSVKAKAIQDVDEFVSSSDLELFNIIVMFLSAVWTLILTAPIHCRGSIGEQVT